MRIGRAEVLARAEKIATRLRQVGAHLELPEGSVESAIAQGLELLGLRKVVRTDGSEISVNPAERKLIGFYAAPVRQHLSAGAASGPRGTPRRQDNHSAET